MSRILLHFVKQSQFARKNRYAGAVSVLADRLREHFDPKAAAEAALRGTERVVAPRGAPADPQRLRGLPMIGGCRGHIPGTRPDALSSTLGRWSGR
jgi:hypothetical protein